MRPDLPVSVKDIETAQRLIAGVAIRSPLISSPGLEPVAGARVMLKMETVQPTGSFKIRGAAARILGLNAEERERGVVAASTGNHGRAVAQVASSVGIPAVVCVSTKVPPDKVRALEGLGCQVIREGDSQEAALETAAEIVADRGMTLVHPFDDPQVIAGQGTIGLEIVEQAPDVAGVLVPLSGGGLVAGLALAAKAHNPAVRILGVSMARAPIMALSLESGRPVEAPEEPTLADSLQGGIGLDNRLTFPMVRELVDEVILVEEDEIWEGMLWLFQRHGVVVEGAGAVGVGAVLAGKVAPGGPTAVVCSGANVETDQLLALGRGGPMP